MCTLLSALGLVGLMVLALPAPALAQPLRVALLPIAVHSSDSEAGYLSDGLAEMLSARLERSGQVEVIRAKPEAAAGTDRNAALEIGQAVGADFVLFGSFTQFGQGASLDIRCAPVSEQGTPRPDPREIFIQSGSVGEIIPKLDDLAEKVTRYMHGDMSTSPVPAEANGAPAPDGLQDLRQRVDALERAVYLGQGAAPPVESGDATPIPGSDDAIEITGSPPAAGDGSAVR